MCSTTTKKKYDYNSNSNNNGGNHHDENLSSDVSKNNNNNNKKKKKKKSGSRLGFFMRFLLRFILFELPVLLCFILLLSTLFLEELWYTPIQQLIDSFKLKPNDNMDELLGLYEARDNEITYYNRKCDVRDISTKDANDLLIEDNMTFEERRSTMLTHGAVVMKNILSKNTSSELRNYLEGRHQEFHANNLQLSWNELFWDGDDGSRLALGLGPEDSSIVKKAISEVGSNPELKKTLESIVGNDPSIVEVSTLSTMHNAEPQGIHTDSDYFGSSVLYTRSFLHSYTMFIALQDTTAKMGATTLCPGTHWCADIDLEFLCQCDNNNDDDNDINDNEESGGVCNTFEASSNGQTGINDGVLLQGDAMMFNQNIWHRGPRNYDLQPGNQKNRVMFILTFVSRRSTIEEGDNRQQGWGTYYYMRHTMWGNTLSDLKEAAIHSYTSSSMNLWTHRIWKAYGLMNASRKGNLPWLEHFARQLANDMDFFESGELDDFKTHLQELKSDNSFINYLFSTSLVVDTNKAANNENDINGSDDDEDGDEDEDDDDDNWNAYLSLLVESAVYQSQTLYFATLLVTIIIYLITTLIQVSSSYSGDQPLKQQQHQQHNQQSTTPSSSSSSSTSSSTSTTSLSRRNRWWFPLLRLVLGHVVIFGTALCIRQYVLYEAPLFKRIYTNEINFPPFQELPSHILGVETHFDDITGEIESTTTHTEQLYPVDILYQKQILEQSDYKKVHPKHTNQYYYEKEIERLQQQHVRNVMPVVVVVVNEIPKQATAYPERYDILIGTRYDAQFLSSMNDMLNYHPGNIIWNNLINEFSEGYGSSAVLDGGDDDETATSMIDITAQNIVNTILGRQQQQSLVLGSSSNCHEGIPRRFLKQDYETGYWIIMTKKEATEITRYELLSSFDSTNTIEFLWTYWKQVLAKSRFGARRNTIMSKKYMPLIVDSWLLKTKNGLLFKKNNHKESCDISSKTKKKPSLLVTPMTTMTIMSASASAASAIMPSLSSSVMPSYYLLPSTARNILPKSLVSGGSSSSSANNSFLNEKNIAGDKTFVSPNVIPFRQHLKELNSNTITLKIGDIITVKGTDANANDNDNDEDDNEESSSSQNQLPYQAMIIDIDDEENLDIQPIRTDNDDDSGTIRSVHINEIQLYRPVNENDKVWVFTTDDNTWKIYEVLSITPWGTADVLLTDEYFLDLYNKNRDKNDDDDDDDDDEDDDGEEEIENEAIVMDIRDFFLIDDEVPFIRLKQY